MNRRDIFKGAAGAAVIASQAGQKAAPDDLASYQAETRGLNFPSTAPDVDPLWEAKRLFMAHAEEEMRRLQRSADRRIDALNDLKSISGAYKRYRFSLGQDEHQRLQARFKLLRAGIGW